MLSRLQYVLVLTVLAALLIGCDLTENPVQQITANSYKVVFLNRDEDVCVLQNVYHPRIIQLTHDHGNSIVRWAPSGDTIAYIGFSSEDNRYASGIFLARSDGTNKKFLTGISQNGQFFSQELTWSPDGLRLAFVSPLNADPGEQNIWVIDTDGTNKKQLTKGGHHERPIWLPDGEHIAFIKLEASETSHTLPQASMQIVNINTGNIMPYLPAISSGLHFSPDGQTVAFAHHKVITETQELYFADVTGRRIRQLTHDGEARFLNGPFGFTTDSKKIFFVSYVSFNYVISNVEISIIDTSGVNRQIVKKIENFAQASLSPDRRKILLSVWRESRGVKTWMDLYILSTDGKEYFKLVEEVRYPDWGPMN
jgi:Tol biopolymer transport system component